MPNEHGYIDIFFEQFSIPALEAGEKHLMKKNGIALQESSIKKFVPIMAISVLNESTQNIKVFVNETDNKAFELPANSSRTLEGYPAWDITVQNIGDASIGSGEVKVTLINDLEQTSRYNAYAKAKGRGI